MGDSQEGENSGNEVGDPPELSVSIPTNRDLLEEAHTFSENFVIDFLLLTAVDCEFWCCFCHLQEPLKYYDTKTGYVYVGKMGDEREREKLTIGLVKCNMGSGVGGSVVTVQNVVTALKPKGVFCVGFCGGMNPTKAKLGDVVVSAKLTSYAPHKVTDSGIEPRGSAVHLYKKMNDIMKQADDGWNPPLKNMEVGGPKVVRGTMLSGPAVVDFKKERDRKLKDYPDAIAIEMEGEGVYTACHNLQTEWVVVKGISDYADGTKDATKAWKDFASMMAASLVAHVLRQPSVFKNWPRYDGGSPDQSPTGSPTKRRKDSFPGPAPNRDNQAKVAFKEGKPNDKELDELAGKIADVWKQLATRLGIKRDVVSVIDANEKDKPHAMLVRWRNTTQSDKPYGELYDALCHERVGLNNLAKEFCCKKTA